jgi:hypothetical protein
MRRTHPPSLRGRASQVTGIALGLSLKDRDTVEGTLPRKEEQERRDLSS